MQILLCFTSQIEQTYKGQEDMLANSNWLQTKIGILFIIDCLSMLFNAIYIDIFFYIKHQVIMRLWIFEKNY